MNNTGLEEMEWEPQEGWVNLNDLSHASALKALEALDSGLNVSWPETGNNSFEELMLSIKTALVHTAMEEIVGVLRNLLSAYNYATEHRMFRAQAAAAQALRRLVPLGLNQIIIARTEICSLAADLGLPGKGNHYTCIAVLSSVVGGVVEKNTLEPLTRLLRTHIPASPNHYKIANFVAANGKLEGINMSSFREIYESEAAALKMAA